MRAQIFNSLGESFVKAKSGLGESRIADEADRLFDDPGATSLTSKSLLPQERHVRHRISTGVAGAAVTAAALITAAVPAQASSSAAQHKATETLRSHHASTAASGSGLLSYGGGPIVTSPKVYIVYWGSQWGAGSTVTNDPSGEAALQLSFFQHAYGSGDTYFTSQTQYCQGVAVGTTQCGSSGTQVGHPSSNPVGGTWLDSGVTAPSRPSDTQIAAEAKRAASHFGVSGTNVQVIVDAPHGPVPNG